MLKQRILTAVGLLAILLPALLWRDTAPFAAVTAALMGAAAWEWGRLNGCSAAWLAGVAVAALPWLLWWFWGAAGWPPVLGAAVTVGWVVVLALTLHRGVDDWGRWPRRVRLAGGWLALACAWWAVVALHTRGPLMLLSVLLLVWVADIAAYFGGRAWGRRKLAPRISPGKSWEGAASGVVAVLALALAWMALSAVWPPARAALYPVLAQQGWLVALLALLGLTALSVAGDLFESLVKRSAGVKDSSGLLPGHGGVLDRIDALLPVLPAALTLLSLSGGDA
ncbi:phosphatidate cytidylyltransferase [Tepidimonas charontis]|uniref:Phosphatidate cytidylyltransferase n=1 Tax=Tepidimonas charontis TaxID=2267262 RepID=A0A554X9V9_9BURK|nr:phosphatidate cytidylyltransferase [Tepidimonas charontis]TSE32635.1 Phosphatidate cytidylyltransferase [Tepidimonas charontis]